MQSLFRKLGLSLFVAMVSVRQVSAEIHFQLDGLEVEPGFAAEFTQWVDVAKELVGADRDVEFADLTIHVAGSETIREIYSDWYRVWLSTQKRYQYVLHPTLFEKSVDAFLRDRMGVYLAETDTILIDLDEFLWYASDRDEYYDIPMKDVAMELLLHELVHAADHQQYDLVNLYSSDHGDYLNVDMLLEGHAQSETERYCKLAGCDEVFELGLESVTPFADADPDDYEYYSRDNTYLKYQTGYQFFKSLKKRDPGLVGQAMRNPPADVVSFFAADRYPETERITANQQVFEMLETIADEVIGEIAGGELHLYFADDPERLLATMRLMEFRNDRYAHSYAKTFFRYYADALSTRETLPSNYRVVSANPVSGQELVQNNWSVFLESAGEQAASPEVETSIFVQGKFLFRLVSFRQISEHSKRMRAAAQYLSAHVSEQEVALSNQGAGCGNLEWLTGG